MGDVPGCNSMKISTSLCEVIPVAYPEKDPYTRKPPKVDLNPIFPHSLG